MKQTSVRVPIPAASSHDWAIAKASALPKASVKLSRERSVASNKMGRNTMQLKIRPLTPDLWPALEDLFGAKGACNGCWCMYWRIGAAYGKRPREMNKAALREVVRRGP